jgi:hypothetical protein
VDAEGADYGQGRARIMEEPMNDTESCNLRQAERIRELELELDLHRR